MLALLLIQNEKNTVIHAQKLKKNGNQRNRKIKNTYHC